MTSTAMLALPAADAVTHSDSSTRLIIAAVLGVAVIIVLIVWSRMHPLPRSHPRLGGARRRRRHPADRHLQGLHPRAGIDHRRRGRAHRLRRGIPLFFEVGIVLLIPVVMIVARRARQPLVLVGVPALAGLSALHGLVPPHPGPLIAIDAVGANLGMTLGLGLLVAVPTVIISGPLAARVMAGWVPVEAPEPLGGSDRAHEGPRPSFGASLSVVLLPVVLMLLRTVVETLVPEDTTNPLAHAALFVGQPVVALLITVLVAMRLFGTRLGLRADEVSGRVGASLGPIAGILLIVGAGGGFKQTLVDSGIAGIIATWIQQAAVPELLAGWLVAVAVRLATGSATVATVTAAGIMAPLAADMPSIEIALLVLAIGAGSVFLSHVNDAGFWLVKEYFGLTVGQTFKTWSLMETILSVTAMVVIGVIALGLGVL